MTSYAEREPPGEYAIVADPVIQNKIIVITNRFNVKDNDWLRSEFNLDSSCSNVLNVAEECIPCLTKDLKSILKSDAYVHNQNIKNAVKTFTDYALYIHLQLLEHNTFVLCCKNGRSRSPNVVLAFLMLFRGMTYSMATSWLTALFKIQRPYIAAKSAVFPNFSKYFNLFNEIERLSTAKTGTYLHKRIKFAYDHYLMWDSAAGVVSDPKLIKDYDRREVLDPKTQQTYYWNTKTQETKWERPSEMSQTPKNTHNDDETIDTTNKSGGNNSSSRINNSDTTTYNANVTAFLNQGFKEDDIVINE
eukprot:g9364.t1